MLSRDLEPQQISIVLVLNGSRLRARRYLVKRSVLINRIRDLPSGLEGLI